jgi:amylosucrase
MALLWEAVATKNARLLRMGIRNLPDKLDRATWLNYIRSHDDIGLGFDDADIKRVGYEPVSHRQFLVEYFTGVFESSAARGLPFGQNQKTGDVRISGTLASLVGLETALEEGDPDEIHLCIKHILLLHSMILSFGGIPMLYYGDELGTLNNYDYQKDEGKARDSRWVHRPTIDWERAALRNTPGTVEYKIFSALKKMIAVRKEIDAFADFDNRELLDVDNEHLFVFSRANRVTSDYILVVGNFDASPQYLDLGSLSNKSLNRFTEVTDLYSGESPAMFKDQIVVPPFHFYWLSGL